MDSNLTRLLCIKLVYKYHGAVQKIKKILKIVGLKIENVRYNSHTNTVVYTEQH